MLFVRSLVSWSSQPHRKSPAIRSQKLEAGAPAAPIAARFSLLECPEKPGRTARIKGSIQQVRDYIRKGGKQQPKAQQLAARKGYLPLRRRRFSDFLPADFQGAKGGA